MLVYSWVLLSLTILVAAGGTYTVATGRAVHWVPEKRIHRDRAFGWAQLLMAAFTSTLLIRMNTDLPYAVGSALLLLGSVSAIGGAALHLVSLSRRTNQTGIR